LALNITEKRLGAACRPIVVCGFGTRAKLTPCWSKIEIVHSSFGFCCSMMR
jgi:hypothetical protein